ncbi:MAG: hypothetical protein KGN01_06800 [Patescibacteria group bacterium]|nr:hypothetical protein [Patescibacteria group bacterium]
MSDSKRFTGSVRIYLKDHDKGSSVLTSTDFEADSVESLKAQVYAYADEIERTIYTLDSHKVICYGPYRHRMPHCDMEFNTMKEMREHWFNTHSRRAIEVRKQARKLNIEETLRKMGQSQL